MNIFEQYGIKEVADCTLYGIALDKNDDVVYVPLIYFDTLKISSLEQTASDVSAQGGIGNPKLITWDFGKDISITLEDALYTPASQSLMWGGRFGLGKAKIRGFWNPIYIGDTYYYTNELLNCKEEDILYPFLEKQNQKPYYYHCNVFKDSLGHHYQPAEMAELIIKNFETFRLSQKRKDKVEETGKDSYLLTEISNSENCPITPWLNGNGFIENDPNIVLDYEWLNCEVQMISQQGKQESFYATNIDILIRTDNEGMDRKILIKYHEDEEYYNSQINFYKIKIRRTNDILISEKIKVGTFYINDDFNYEWNEQDNIYPIDSGIDDTQILERMEKCIAAQTFCINTDRNLYLNNEFNLNKNKNIPMTIYIDPRTMKPYEPNSNSFTQKNGKILNGKLRIIKKDEVYYKHTRLVTEENFALGRQIIVDAKHFPGNFRLVGETRSRRRVDGKDERYQFEIPLCKMSPQTSLTLQAEGEPTTFTMNLKVLQRDDGVMMKLTQYDIDNSYYNNQISNSTEAIPYTTKFKGLSCGLCQEPIITIIPGSSSSYEILLPLSDEYYCIPIDCAGPYIDGKAYLALPKTLEEAESIYALYKQAISTGNYSTLQQYRDILLATFSTSETQILIDGKPYQIANTGISSYSTTGLNFVINNGETNTEFTVFLGQNE